MILKLWSMFSRIVLGCMNIGKRKCYGGGVLDFAGGVGGGIAIFSSGGGAVFVCYIAVVFVVFTELVVLPLEVGVS